MAEKHRSEQLAMKLVRHHKLKFAASTVCALLLGVSPVSLSGQTGAGEAASQMYGYAEVEPLASDQESAMLARVEEIKKIPAEAFEARQFEAANKVRLVYRLLRPKDYDPRVKYPLLVVLHGSGAIGVDNVSQLGIFAKSWARPEYRSSYPCFVVAPQFPSRSVEYARTAGGVRVSRPLPPLHAALDLIDAVGKEFNVDRNRVYIMGFSMGGSSAINALFLRPRMFAAAVSIAGVPNPETAERIARVPLWIMHGNRDPENEFGPDKIMYETLVKRGARKVRFWELDGVAHDVPARIFGTRELPEWLFRHRR